MLLAMRSSAGLDERRRKVLFRCWHRGTREMDMILGPYANATIEEMSDRELLDFETLIAHQDTDLTKWFLGQAAVPKEVAGEAFDRVATFARRFTHPGLST